MKKALIYILSLTLLVSCLSVGGALSVSAAELIPGDVNGNGRVNVQDLAALQRHLNGWEIVVDTAAADVNADDKVNDDQEDNNE